MKPLHFLSFLFLFPFVLLAQEPERAEFSEFQFVAAPPRSGTGMRLEQTGPNALKMAMTTAKDFGSEWIYADFEHETTAQRKLVFRVRGNAANGGAFFHPAITVQSGGQTKLISGPRIQAGREDDHFYVLGLDSDFQLGDGRYTVKRLEFSFNSEREPIGKDLSVEIDRIRFTDPEEALTHGRKPYDLVSGLPPRETPDSGESKAKTAAQAKKKIYFCLENNDRTDFLWYKNEKRPEFPGTFGFRNLMLENCPFFEIAEVPEDADLIVYQRTLAIPESVGGDPSGKEAETLAALIRSGKPVIFYGPIPDPALAELAPLKLTRLDPDHFAPRERIIPASEGWKTVEPQNCSFGRYFDTEPTEGAESLLNWAESKTPFLVRKGNVWHAAGTCGQTLIPSETFYDRAALLIWAEMAGISDAARTLNQLEKEPKVLKKDGLEWRQTTRGFGRFGWAVGDPGLCDAVGPDLSVTNGEQSYRVEPVLALGGPAPEEKPTLKCTATDVHKTFTLPDQTLTMTLLAPFELWEFPASREVFLRQENIADFAVWADSTGALKTANLAEKEKSETFFDLGRDGKWGAPWLLLFREKAGHPLLVVFPSQPKKIAASVQYGAFAGLEIQLGENPVLVAGWPFGSKLCGGDAVWNALDQKGTGAEFLAHSLALALNFPIDRTEYFALDPKNQRIQFRLKVKFRRFADDWGLNPEPVVTLPPLTAFMLQESLAGRLDEPKNAPMVKTSETLTDLGIATNFGPMLGKTGRSVTWSLPLPDAERDLLLVKMKDEKFKALAQEQFLDGVRWTCGGRRPLEHVTPEFPHGKESLLQNISHFTWNFGMGTAFQGKLLLDAEAQTALERRAAIRTISPVELYQPKMCARNRQEPFSGLCYPVMFASMYPVETPFQPGCGSGVVYGDTNEAACVVAWTSQEFADLYGMADWVRANWNFHRYVMRHQLFIDDYCFQAGSCRESGAGAWIDMLNAEYSGMIAYARLAEIAGDENARAEALARAAKRAVPTIARLYFNPYLERLRPELKGTPYLVTGFGEEGAKILKFPTKSGNFYASNELFDYSQGIPGTQYQLYRKYGWRAIQKYVTETAWPNLMTPEASQTWYYLGALGLYDENTDQILQFRERLLSDPKKTFSGDWPGMCRPFQLAATQWPFHHRIAFTRYRDLVMKTAEFDPETGILRAEFTARPGSKLEFHSEKAPKSAALNGETFELNGPEPNFWTVPVKPGENRLEVKF